MAIRYKVTRGYVRFGKKVFFAGELMPPEFTERDKMRNIYSRRLVRVEVDESSDIPDTPVDNIVINDDNQGATVPPFIPPEGSPTIDDNPSAGNPPQEKEDEQEDAGKEPTKDDTPVKEDKVIKKNQPPKVIIPAVSQPASAKTPTGTKVTATRKTPAKSSKK